MSCDLYDNCLMCMASQVKSYLLSLVSLTPPIDFVGCKGLYELSDKVEGVL